MKKYMFVSTMIIIVISNSATLRAEALGSWVMPEAVSNTFTMLIDAAKFTKGMVLIVDEDSGELINEVEYNSREEGENANVSIYRRSQKGMTLSDWIILALAVCSFILVLVAIKILKVKFESDALYKKSRHFSDSALELVSDGVIIVDNYGVVENMNGVAERMLGRSSESNEGEDISSMLIDSFVQDEDIWESLTRDVITGDACVKKSISLKVGDEGTVDVELSVKPIISKTGYIEGTVLILKEETDKSKLHIHKEQEQLLEDLQLSTRTTAHDINSILTGITSMSEVARIKHESGSDDKEYIGNVLDSCDRLAEVVKKLQHEVKNNNDSTK